MSDQPRITPNEVLAAYDKTGLRPVFGCWWKWHGDGVTCCCPVAVLYESISGTDGDCIGWAHETYGVEYTDSFINGVDGGPEGGTGYADGRAVRQAIIESGLLEAAL